MSDVNPYSPFFARLDVLVPAMEDNMLTSEQATELADLVRRAAFVLANHLNTEAAILPTLILPEDEPVEGDGDADSRPPVTT